MIYSYQTHKDVYDDTVKTLQIELSKNGYLDIKNINGYYDLNTERAFKKFQKDTNRVEDGVFNSVGFVVDDIEVKDHDGKLSRSTRDVATPDNEVYASREEKPFFNDDKSYVFRKGNINILIEYANSDKQRRMIEGVKIRSMSQVIDVNGEAIADVYQFVGRDIIEYNK